MERLLRSDAFFALARLEEGAAREEGKIGRAHV